MKIGIIVHSQTEHTYSVAQKLREKLISVGHEAYVERVIPVGDVAPGAKDIKFENKPDSQLYDALIFGAPVHAFSLSPAMKAYLEQLPSLQNKIIACFVTKGAPFKWTGGTRAIGQMKKICNSLGGEVSGTGIIVWNSKRDKEIDKLIDKLTRLF
jgi:NAD(P)H dehydrogenase (quinone)